MPNEGVTGHRGADHRDVGGDIAGLPVFRAGRGAGLMSREGVAGLLAADGRSAGHRSASQGSVGHRAAGQGSVADRAADEGCAGHRVAGQGCVADRAADQGCAGRRGVRADRTLGRWLA